MTALNWKNRWTNLFLNINRNTAKVKIIIYNSDFTRSFEYTAPSINCFKSSNSRIWFGQATIDDAYGFCGKIKNPYINPSFIDFVKFEEYSE